MMELSIGLVSGFIAIAVAVVQLVVPNALVVILVASLNQEHPAVTWSVVSRTLANSLWPVFLRSDLATSQRVPFKISLVTWIRPLAMALIAVAAIVTPIGLYEGMVLTHDTQPTTFAFAADPGTMGYGTPPRSNLGFSRQCWGDLSDPRQCPGTHTVINRTENATSATVSFGDDGYDRRFPKALVQLYQSGLAHQPRSVSSYFDVQSRQYALENLYNINNDSYIVDSFRAMSSMIMDDSISLIDGLIVDMHRGGVGFRKHTTPTDLKYGAEWDEDILFLTPETSCVDINMTIEVQLPGMNAKYDGSKSGYLVDRGGFVHINKTSPYLDPWHDQFQDAILNDSDASLERRAYMSGWWMNVLNMYYFNVTKPNTNRTAYLTSEIGKRFPVNNTFIYSAKDRLDFAKYDNLFSGVPGGIEADNGSILTSNYSFDVPYYSNPFNMTSYNWSDVEPLCAGVLGGDYPNMTNIDVRCGLIIGPAARLDGSQSTFPEAGSWWTRPIYSCSSATKASIKTVRFNFNASMHDGLTGLSVVSLQDKVYADKLAMPLWGVETPKDFVLKDIGPLWGLISPDLKHSVNLTTIQSDKLYIPASSKTVWKLTLPGQGLTDGSDFSPGTNGPPQIWNTIYDQSQYSGSGGVDYSGSSNLALLSKWQQLSKNTTGMAYIANLLWTDYAANYYTGTRSWNTPADYIPPNLQKRDIDSVGPVDETNGAVPIQVYERRIRYHLVYGIPAALALVVSALICAGAFLAMVVGRGGFNRIRHYIWTLSPGRLLATFLFPGEGDPHADTRAWVDRVGGKSVRIVDSEVMQLLHKQRSPAPEGAYFPVNQKEPLTVGVTTAYEPGVASSPKPQPVTS